MDGNTEKMKEIFAVLRADAHNIEGLILEQRNDEAREIARNIIDTLDHELDILDRGVGGE